MEDIEAGAVLLSAFILNSMKEKMLKPIYFIDKKLDDGIYNSGNVRAGCYLSSYVDPCSDYEEGINKKGFADFPYFRVY